MFTTPKIIFSKNDINAVLPFRNSISDAGYILSSTESKIISDGEYVEVSTGLVVEDIVKGVWGLIVSNDEILNKNGIQAVFKCIENNFRGELKILLYNSSDKGYYMECGDKIAKLVYFPLMTIEPELIEKNESLQ